MNSLLLVAGLTVAGASLAAEELRLGQPYTGLLPCADCGGIRTRISFHRLPDGSLGYRAEETYLATRDGEQRITTLGRAEELGGTRANPWARRVRIDPQFPDSRRHFLVLSPSVIEMVGANGERASSRLDYKLVLDRNAPPLARPVDRQRWAGTLRRAGERLELLPCGGGAPLPAIDLSVENSLTAALTDIGFDRVDGMYVEAWGRKGNGTLQLERLNRAGTEMRCPEPQAPVPAWRAQGNEPFWSISDDNGRLTFSRPGQATLSLVNGALLWRWRGERSDLAAASIRAESGGTRIAGELKPGLCRDTMADAVYGWRFEGRLEAGGKTTPLKGCAALGAQGLPG